MNTLMLIYVIGVGLSFILRMQGRKRLFEYIELNKTHRIMEDIILSLIPIWNYISILGYLTILIIKEETLLEISEIYKKMENK